MFTSGTAAEQPPLFIRLCRVGSSLRGKAKELSHFAALKLRAPGDTYFVIAVPWQYPTLRAEDLVNAWTYVQSNKEETDRQTHENEAAWLNGPG